MKSLDMTPHNLSYNEVLESLKSNPEGLTEADRIDRLKKYGPNLLPSPKKEGVLKRFIIQFHSPLIYVLLASAIITLLINHYIDTLVILTVAIVNAVIGFFHEGKAEKAVEAIRKILAPYASVLCNGKRIKIPVIDLVPGDIVLLEAGDKVPADLRLIKSHALRIQESILTGESEPVTKHTDAVPIDAPLGDRKCLAFSGTLVTAGQGKGVVLSTGKKTEVGKIVGMLSNVEILTTPLVRQIARFAKWITSFILATALVIFLYGYFIEGYSFTEIFMIVVSFTVAAIPAGLPATLSITLAIGVQKMAKKNTIVRKLPAIETLGSVSVICTDKTGTLTLNEMMVASAVTATHSFAVEGSGYQPEGKIHLEGTLVTPNEFPQLEEMALVSLLCNDAELALHEGFWVTHGDPMEGALLSFAGKLKMLSDEKLSRWTSTGTIPFDPTNRYMATLHHGSDKKAYIFVKGAPEEILAMSDKERLSIDKTAPVKKEYWHKRIDELAKKGQRVLALALKEVDHGQKNLETSHLNEGLILVGLVGLIDPPRPEAIKAVKDCQEAMIRVLMITGDHAATALAIGKQIGLKNLAPVLTGKEVDAMSEIELKAAVLNTDIFARTSPKHKLRLVTALQSHGLVVAMTGDGVNDAPALKRADIGIAMGIKGSDAAKEVAQFVLADDSFASIAAAVKEGRTVYDNLKKVVSWTLPTNAGEASTIIVALFLGLSLPVTPLQILWVNLVTMVTLGVALALEPTEESTMKRPPRPMHEPILNFALVWHVILVSFLFLLAVYGIFRYALNQGYSINLARTFALNMLVVLEIFHLFFIRNIYSSSLTWKLVKGTPVIWASIITVTIGQFAITYLEFFQKIFETMSVPVYDGWLILLIGVLFFGILEGEKQLRLRYFKP